MTSCSRFSRVSERLADIFLHQETDRRRLRIRCAIAAVLLLISAYPDVIFRGASLSLVNFLNVTIEPRPAKVQILPERAGREAFHGHADAGGSAYQSEPSIQFVTRAIWSGQSLYWNPYSATGMYGIETLVDVKTSPLTILTALLGGSDAAFHIVLLGLNLLGLYCLLVLLAIELRLCLLAAIAGGVTYALNGVHVPHPGVNFFQTWLYFPVLALALVSFAKAPRTGSFLGIAAGAVLVLSTVFLATTLVVLATTLWVGAAAALAFSVSEPDWKQMLASTGRIIAGQAAAVLLAMLILAVVYLPIFESLRYMATGEFYAKRVFYPYTWFNFISLFSPKHAFEAYNAMSPRAIQLSGEVVYHQGIVGALFALQAVRAWPPVQRVFASLIAIALILLVGRAFGVPGTSEVIGIIPVLGSVRNAYLLIGIAILFTLLVPFGMHGLLRSGVRRLPLAAGALLILGALAHTTSILGVETRYALFYIVVAVLFVLVASLLLVALLHARRPVIPAILLVLLSWSELTFYVNHFKLSRTDRFSEPPRFVRFLQTHVGLHRVASYGHYGIPPEYGAAYGVYQIGSMNFQIFPRYFDLFNRLLLPGQSDRWVTFATFARAKDTDRINLPAFDLAGTKYLVTPFSYTRLQAFMERSGWPPVYQDTYFSVFENPAPLPRALIVPRLVFDPKTPLDLGRSPRDVATTDDPHLFEQARLAGLTAQDVPSDRKPGVAAITRYDHARVEIAAKLSSPGMLVLNDAWHPNWSVTVDGQPHRLGVVNQAFRGLILPAGIHVVEMTYAPRTLAIAKMLTVLGLLAALGLWLARRRLDPLLARWRPGRKMQTGHAPAA